MKPRQLKLAAADQPIRAHIVSDGCRDYVVEVVSRSGAGLLRHWRGRTLKFRSLGEIHQLLHRCGVRDAVLRQRVADDEAASGQPMFHDQPLTVRH
jgi:hypothetical protein